MAGTTSLDAVKRRIKSLQEQADAAEDRAERLQSELLAEKKTREQVSMLITAYSQTGAAHHTPNDTSFPFAAALHFIRCVHFELTRSGTTRFLL